MGRVFTIYKIRTMHHDSERTSGPRWSAPGDPRVTNIGRLLHWSHVDELPQLINILKGEMSWSDPGPNALSLSINSSVHYLIIEGGCLSSGLDRLGPGAATPRHRPLQRPPQAELRPVLRRTNESVARLSADRRHGHEVHGLSLRVDRSNFATPRSQPLASQ